MKRCIAAVTALLLLTAYAARAAENITERIPLTYLKPSAVVSMFAESADTKDSPQNLLPKGVVRLVPHDRERQLSVRGSRESIAQMRTLIRLLDVKPRQALLKLRVLRYTFDGTGKYTAETLQSPVVSTTNNHPVVVEIKAARKNGAGEPGCRVEVIPRINGDDSITVFGSLRVTHGGSVYQTAKPASRRLTAGETRLLTGVATVRDPRLQKAVLQGDVPVVSEAFTAYYLEVTPSLINEDSVARP